MKHYSILGNKVTSLSVAELNNKVHAIISEGKKELVLNTNIHGVNLAHRLPWLKEFRNRAIIVHCDSAGVKWGLKMLGYEIPCRITVHDWMNELAPVCITNSFTVYFLGAKPGIAETAAANLKREFPGLDIIGTHHGHFSKQGKENDKVISMLNAARPDILIVGFGMPLQERWIMENWEKIDARIFVAGGGCFDVWSGALHRCPEFLASSGLEWLFRFVNEPRRLFSRYIIGNPLFVWRVLGEKMARTRYAPRIQ